MTENCTCVPNQWLDPNPDCKEHGHVHCWHTHKALNICCICEFDCVHSEWEGAAE